MEQALIARFGTLGRATAPFLLRSDNGMVFTSRRYTALVRSYGLQQEFITPDLCPWTKVLPMSMSHTWAAFFRLPFLAVKKGNLLSGNPRRF
ncbi:MAG TPA: hypothetical protein VIU93_07055 [Gallionellaceae bacterium]